MRRSRFTQTIINALSPVDFADHLDRLQAEIRGEARGTVDDTFAPTPLVIEAGQPDCLFEGEGRLVYRGQERTKERIVLRVDTLAPTERFKCLLTGPAGTGKTTLARLIALRIQQRHRALGLEVGPYFELLPAQIESKGQLDGFMGTIAQSPTAIVFIDEVHKLVNVEALFHTLHDSGLPKFPIANGGWLDIPQTVSWITATTDPGSLDTTNGGALRRRLQPEFRLEPPDVSVLAEIVTDLAGSRDFGIQHEAAEAIATRAVFPWQAAHIFSEVLLVARDRASTSIALDHALDAFEIMEIDEHGLQREDRDVIAALLRAPYRLAGTGQLRYRMGEEALCAASGVDRASYKKSIQPKLIRLGLLTTTGGQSLTDKAVELYGHLV